MQLHKLVPTQRQHCAGWLVKHRGRPYPGRSTILGVRAVDVYEQGWGRIGTLLFWISNPVLFVRVRWALWVGGVGRAPR